MNVLAIDCGGTFIKAGLVSEAGEILDHCSLPTDVDKGVHTAVDKLQNLIENYKERICAVGMAFAGPLDPKRGVVIEPPNFPKEWRQLPLVEIIEKRTQIPVFLENDANLAALGEYWKGAGQGVDVLVVMTLGTGVGGGIVLGGNLWNGATGIAGEIGHIPVAETGPICGCGNVGCLETFASSTAVVRMAQELKGAGNTTWSNCEILNAEKVYKLAKNGDVAANSIFTKLGQALGEAIAVIGHTLGPRKVVLTGGGAGAWDLFQKEMQRTFQKRAFQKEREIMEIVPAKLAEQSGILGAAYFAFQKIGVDSGKFSGAFKKERKY